MSSNRTPHTSSARWSDDDAPSVFLDVRLARVRDVVDALRVALRRWPSTLCLRWHDDVHVDVLDAAAVLNVLRYHSADPRCRLERLEWQTSRGPPLPAWAMQPCVRGLQTAPLLRTVRWDVVVETVSPVTARWLAAIWETAIRRWHDWDLGLRIGDCRSTVNPILRDLFQTWANAAHAHGSATPLRRLTLTLELPPDASLMTATTLGVLTDAMLRVNVEEWGLRLVDVALYNPSQAFVVSMVCGSETTVLSRLRTARLDVRRAGLGNDAVTHIVRAIRVRAPALRTLTVDGTSVA